MGTLSRREDRRTLRVFVVGDDPFGRHDLEDRLEREVDFTVVGTAETSSAAVAGVPASNADVVVVDDRLIDDSGMSLIARLREAGCSLPFIVHAALPPQSDVAAGWGADAVVLKSLMDDAFEAEIRRLVEFHEAKTLDRS